MKRIYVGTLLCIILSLGLLTGCDQGVARSLGGDMTLCSHRDVCQYKSEYLAAQTAVDEVSVRRPSKDDESIRSIRLHDIPWIEPVELKCRYFHQNTGAVR